MSLQITARNVDLTDDIKEYVEKKINKLHKFFDSTSDVHVILRAEKFRQIAEVTVMFNGITIHGQTQTNDLFSSMDKVTDKVQRQIVKEKTRAIAIKTRKNQEMKETFDTVSSAEEPASGPTQEIIRGEAYSTAPLIPEEAVTRMRDEKKDYLLFMNSLTNEVNLLQEREDGKFWLVEPESE